MERSSETPNPYQSPASSRATAEPFRWRWRLLPATITLLLSSFCFLRAAIQIPSLLGNLAGWNSLSWMVWLSPPCVMIIGLVWISAARCWLRGHWELAGSTSVVALAMTMASMGV
ncbi:MAG: hypothetical protein N2C14_03185 [Planctomycetales bacterium]